MQQQKHNTLQRYTTLYLFVCKLDKNDVVQPTLINHATIKRVIQKKNLSLI